MAKKTKKAVKTLKAGTKRKQSTGKTSAKKRVVKTKPAKAKKSSAAKTSRAAVKASKPKRKPVASRKRSIASTASPSPKLAKSTPKVTDQKTNNPHPGMMGDGTEEQNLNQQGTPGARVTQDDVDAAFKKSD
jgi:hypothetical protein